MTAATKFYVHPSPALRARQKAARKQALESVKAGAIRWDTTDLNTRGFVYATPGARIEQRDGLDVLIALYELRSVGKVSINYATGAVTATAGGR